MSGKETFELAGLILAFAVALLLIGLLTGVDPATVGILVAVFSAVFALPVAKWFRKRTHDPGK